MITGWLVKIILGIAILGFLVIELGSPVVVKIQIDGVAHDVADAAGLDLRSGGTPESAQAEAQRVAEDNGATLEEFRVETEGQERRARVTVRKEARSFLLKKWDRTEDWYDITKSATSADEGE